MKTKLILFLLTLFISFGLAAEEPLITDYAACGIILKIMDGLLIKDMAIKVAMADITADELDAAIKAEIKLIDEIGKDEWIDHAVYSCKILGYIIIEDKLEN